MGTWGVDTDVEDIWAFIYLHAPRLARKTCMVRLLQMQVTMVWYIESLLDYAERESWRLADRVTNPTIDKSKMNMQSKGR